MKLVQVLESNREGTKYEIYQQDNGNYGFTYFERNHRTGIWREIFSEADYSEDALEYEFGCKVV